MSLGKYYKLLVTVYTLMAIFYTCVVVFTSLIIRKKLYCSPFFNEKVQLIAAMQYLWKAMTEIDTDSLLKGDWLLLQSTSTKVAKK